MVSTPTRTTAARAAAGGASQRQRPPARRPASAAPANGRRPRRHPRGPGACLVPRILVRAGRHRQVPQRIHVLPDPRLHPGADGDRHHDGPLGLQRGSHRRGGVAVLRRPQAGRIRRDRRLRDVCPLPRQRRLAQALRLAAHRSWPLRCWAWSSWSGRSALGNQNWIDVGPFTFQPSEAAKLALALWMATVLDRKAKLLHEWRHALIPVVLPGAVAVLGLILAGNDLGTAMIVMIIVAAALFFAGVRLYLFGFAGAVAGRLARRSSPSRARTGCAASCHGRARPAPTAPT